MSVPVSTVYICIVLKIRAELLSKVLQKCIIFDLRRHFMKFLCQNLINLYQSYHLEVPCFRNKKLEDQFFESTALDSRKKFPPFFYHSYHYETGMMMASYILSPILYNITIILWQELSHFVKKYIPFFSDVYK